MTNRFTATTEPKKPTCDYRIHKLAENRYRLERKMWVWWVVVEEAPITPRADILKQMFPSLDLKVEE